MAKLDAGIESVYKAILDDKDPKTFCVLGYRTPAELYVTDEGDGTIKDVVDKFHDDQCQFAYIRVTTGDTESRRAKFVLLTWIGEGAKVLQKAKMSVHKASVKSVFKNISCEFQASTKDELEEEKLMTFVKKAGGANYSGNSWRTVAPSPITTSRRNRPSIWCSA